MQWKWSELKSFRQLELKKMKLLCALADTACPTACPFFTFFLVLFSFHSHLPGKFEKLMTIAE
jgi:hypothetical protein